MINKTRIREFCFNRLIKDFKIDEIFKVNFVNFNFISDFRPEASNYKPWNNFG